MYGIVAAVVAGALLLGGLVWQTHRVEAARSDAARAIDAAAASKAALDRLEADQKFGERIVADLARVEARLDFVRTETIREIVKLPVTVECLRAPAIGLAVERLRGWPDAAADGRAPAAGGSGTAVPAAPRAGQARQ